MEPFWSRRSDSNDSRQQNRVSVWPREASQDKPLLLHFPFNPPRASWSQRQGQGFCFSPRPSWTSPRCTCCSLADKSTGAGWGVCVAPPTKWLVQHEILPKPCRVVTVPQDGHERKSPEQNVWNVRRMKATVNPANGSEQNLGSRAHALSILNHYEGLYALQSIQA